MAKLNRRAFLSRAGGVTAAALTAGVVDRPALDRNGTIADAAEMGSGGASDRRWQAYRLRHDAAMAHSSQPFPSFPTNGDEEAYPNRIASYTKGPPHNERGEVDLNAYTALLKAVETGQYAAFEAIPLGGRVKFANPQASYAFALEGPDPHQFAMIAPPAFSSAETASEMVEVYWQALTRDVPFAEYEAHPLINAAAADLSRCTAFRGPKSNNMVIPATLFRGSTPGDLVGPYLSQFLWLDVYQGTITIAQRNRVPIAKDDYMMAYPEWLNIQRGHPPARANVLDPTPRYLRNGRALAEYVHRDFTYQAFGSYLLPMAYPEGCPTHPAYPAGHAAIAGACATVLKAFFSESFVVVNPVIASADGLSLLPYKGSELTVGGELNKLASNIALGRDTAGVHWRSDGIEGLKLGEAVTIGILTDLRATCPEPFAGFSFTKFDGSRTTI
jgi:hypothetical protein